MYKVSEILDFFRDGYIDGNVIRPLLLISILKKTSIVLADYMKWQRN
jgi:hypothetical protein